MPSVEEITQSPEFKIPLIDFSKFLRGTADERSRCSREVIKGFTSSGFLYLSNHGIEPERLEKVFDWSSKYFDLPKPEKEKMAWQGPESNRGYSSMGKEKVTNVMDANRVYSLRKTVPDLKESLEVGNEDDKKFTNDWPEALPGFKETMIEFFNTCNELHKEVMRAIAHGLGIKEDWFDRYMQNGDCTLRLLHYPSVPKEVFTNKEQLRAGTHSDYGSITLLFQDDSGGLQVQCPNGSFINATPIPGTIVVNAGDLLARWSNDIIKSTNHRVVQPLHQKVDQNGYFPARYSIAYFCNPDYDKVIDCIEGCASESRPKAYDAIKSGDWLVYRLSATYT